MRGWIAPRMLIRVPALSLALVALYGKSAVAWRHGTLVLAIQVVHH